MITGALIGDRELVQRVSSIPQAAHDELVLTVQRLIYAVEARSKAGYLRGPRPLHLGVVTGRLSGSVTTHMEVTSDSVYGICGTNVGYGKAWELGFTRKIGAGARGGPRTLTGGARERYFAKHPPGVKQVGARPFLAPALEDIKPQALQEIPAAYVRGMQKALGR